MSTSKPITSHGDELTNLGLGLLLAGAGLAVMLRVAGSVGAWMTGIPQPAAGIDAGLAVVLDASDPAAALHAPGLNPVAYWGCVAMLILVAGSGIVLGWRLLRRTHRRSTADPYRIPGIAGSHDVAKAASKSALMKRAAHLRPALTNAKPTDVGYLIGHSRSSAVWASVEDSILVIGPPRSGKGAHIVINAIFDAPGAVVTTSTRPDNLTATLRARARIGPIAVFDPQQLADGVPAGLRWSPIRGCENPLTAMIRAAGLASGTGMAAGGVESGGFWEAKTRTALQSLLHAAALADRQPSELFRWTLDPAVAAEAVAILVNEPRAATGWSDSLQAMLESDPRTRDSIWQGVSLALGALADPRVLAAVSPADGESFGPGDLPPQQRNALPPRNGRRRKQLRRPRGGLRGGCRGVRPTDRRAKSRRTPRPPTAARARRDRKPRPAAVIAHADGGGWRHRDHDDAGSAVTHPGPLEMERQRRRRDLGCLDRQDHPRRRVQLPRPPRPRHPHRRPGRDHRFHHGR